MDVLYKYRQKYTQKAGRICLSICSKYTYRQAVIQTLYKKD